MNSISIRIFLHNSVIILTVLFQKFLCGISFFTYEKKITFLLSRVLLGACNSLNAVYEY